MLSKALLSSTSGYALLLFTLYSFTGFPRFLVSYKTLVSTISGYFWLWILLFLLAN
jgi:hypothetical protein